VRETAAGEGDYDLSVRGQFIRGEGGGLEFSFLKEDKKKKDLNTENIEMEV